MPRFKSRILTETVIREGKITLDDLQRAFKIPVNADVFILAPSETESGDQIDIDNSLQSIRVRWETVK